MDPGMQRQKTQMLLYYRIFYNYMPTIFLEE